MGTCSPKHLVSLHADSSQSVQIILGAWSQKEKKSPLLKKGGSFVSSPAMPTQTFVIFFPEFPLFFSNFFKQRRKIVSSCFVLALE